MKPLDKTDAPHSFPFATKTVRAVLLLITVCFNSVFAEPACEIVMGKAPDEGYSKPRQIKYSFELKNRKGSLVKDVDFWVYAPVARTATQWCKMLQLSHPAELITDELGNQVLHFRFEELDAYSITIVRIKADLMISGEVLPQQFTEKDLVFSKSSKYIQSDQPEITTAARKFKTGDAYQTAQRINMWAADHIKGDNYTRSRLGALYALKEAKGDCTESADLFAALCRANEIPARTYGGYICLRDMIISAESYHNWSEFYDGKVWRLADPNMNRFDELQSNYIAFQARGNNTSSPMKHYTRYRLDGNGISVKMN